MELKIQKWVIIEIILIYFLNMSISTNHPCHLTMARNIISIENVFTVYLSSIATFYDLIFFSKILVSKMLKRKTWSISHILYKRLMFRSSYIQQSLFFAVIYFYKCSLVTTNKDITNDFMQNYFVKIKWGMRISSYLWGWFHLSCLLKLILITEACFHEFLFILWIKYIL